MKRDELIKTMTGWVGAVRGDAIHKRIVDAYNRPVQDYVNASGRGALEGLPIDQMTNLANAATQILNAADAVKK